MYCSKATHPRWFSTARHVFAIADGDTGRLIPSSVYSKLTQNRSGGGDFSRGWYHHDSNQCSGQLPREVAVVGAKSLVREGIRRDRELARGQVAPRKTAMIREVLESALEQAGLTSMDLDGVVALPSLNENHFMEAHYQATALGLFAEREEDRIRNDASSESPLPRPLLCRTLDTGGAGPVSALLEAERMISSSSNNEGSEVVAVIAADTVGSMTGGHFLNAADNVFFELRDELGLPEESVASPAIPHGYSRITEHQLSTTSLTREQLRMVVSLESFHAGLHPESLQSKSSRTETNTSDNHSIGDAERRKDIYSYTTLEKIRTSPSVAPNLSLLECARRADGAACLILASDRFLKRRNLWKADIPTIIGGGEFSGPLYPLGTHQDDPQTADGITDFTYLSCQQAMDHAYASAGNLTANDIDYFGLYDCFPICLIRAIEACGLVGEGSECKTGGDYVEKQYTRMLKAMRDGTVDTLLLDRTFFPINTHGGLLCFGAPWEVPAMFGIVEAVDQIADQSSGRSIHNCRRAVVYGNGGVLSASAVAILAAG